MRSQIYEMAIISSVMSVRRSDNISTPNNWAPTKKKNNEI